MKCLLVLHISHILFVLKIHQGELHGHSSLLGFKLKLSFFLFCQTKQAVSLRVWLQEQSIVTTPFFCKKINEYRVFVCTDQYVVMKALLQFPTKASPVGWRWICFIFIVISLHTLFLSLVTVSFCFLWAPWPRLPPHIVMTDWMLAVFGFGK